ncbi:hypothetical protein F4V43_09935 [Paenibacillus spiritus]|uniref:Type II secretion system protein GspF domain-containing protein n=1 Tax=Paenibacillus spiritus TaxID=2496557 RepID=A0A5J5GAC8_9BACL|nr:hypothetical protein [Paenibacillus spiritus]KAA9004931.1 hypothetical protein F4V43_09935 [Paenibacillus spiritus]
MAVLAMVRFTLHLVAACGLWLLVQPLIVPVIEGLDFRTEGLRRERDGGERWAEIQRKYRFCRHLDNLLYLASPLYAPGTAVVRFLAGTVLLGLTVFLSSWVTLRELPGYLGYHNALLSGTLHASPRTGTGSWRLALFLTVLATLLPYLRLRYRYAGIRVKASYDLLEVVKLAAKYTHLPVDALLEQTAASLAGDNVLRHPLQRLAASFAGYSTEHELREETIRFASSISTTFAAAFVSDLRYAEREGTGYLKNALLPLTRSMEEQRETILAVKANARDAISLGLYGNLIVLFSSVGTFMYMLRPGVYFRLQFQTRSGLIFFMVIAAGLFLSFAVSTVLAKPKLDYH